MMRRALLPVLGLVLAVAVAAGCSDFHLRPQSRHPGAEGKPPAKGTAAWVVDQYYAESWFARQAHHMTQAFARSDNREAIGPSLPRSARILMRPLVEERRSAVFATTITNADTTTEWYTFLVYRQGRWKIDAVRTLRLDADSASGDDDMMLARASDSALKAHFSARYAVFDSIADLFRARAQMTPVDVSDEADPEIRDGRVVAANRNERLHDLLAHAGVSAAFMDARSPHCVFVRIAGVQRRQVGYMFAPAGCQPPTMEPDRFIYVEAIGHDWYAYRAI